MTWRSSSWGLMTPPLTDIASEVEPYCCRIQHGLSVCGPFFAVPRVSGTVSTGKLQDFLRIDRGDLDRIVVQHGEDDVTGLVERGELEKVVGRDTSLELPDALRASPLSFCLRDILTYFFLTRIAALR